jgi:epoxyqueuosine reductase
VTGRHEISLDGAQLVKDIRQWGEELGFDAIGIAGIELPEEEHALQAWLAAGFHGEMDYMARHGTKRTRPAELVPGTISVITARMNYWPEVGQANAEAVLADPARAYVARYALGRDYHKVLRARLQKLADRIAEATGPFGFRVFVDSAPVMEAALAARSGIGWRGKHTLLLHREAGSYFFLGEIYVDLSLPVDVPITDHCGTCSRCMAACPTGAIVGPHRLDARRCISYLTIELQSAIPESLRSLIGNRIYGCDDCQLVCPWNRFARKAVEADFAIRHGLDGSTDLLELFAWTEAQFAARMAGSPILRIGHERWLRNIAVALGNAPYAASVVAALQARRQNASALVQEHIDWALTEQMKKGEAQKGGCGAVEYALPDSYLSAMAFAENLKQIPGVSHLAALQLLNDQGDVVATIENKAGQTGSLAVYNHLGQLFGAITPDAASKGLELYAEHTEDARTNPGKHPNIDRLLGLIERGQTLRVKHVFAE